MNEKTFFPSQQHYSYNVLPDNQQQLKNHDMCWSFEKIEWVKIKYFH